MVNQIEQITPALIRQYILWLDETGHNAGGRHAAYRTLRHFLYWYEDKGESEGWRNPIHKVKAPRVPVEPIDPVPFDVITKMVKSCKRGAFAGYRDEAILLCLLDTGARAGEFLALNLDNLNQARGDLLIRQGKGRKPRTIYIGKKSKRALRRYLKHRQDDNIALWFTPPRFGSNRLSYDDLRSVLKRRAQSAKVEKPTLHDFRRAFCLAMLRN